MLSGSTEAASERSTNTSTGPIGGGYGRSWVASRVLELLEQRMKSSSSSLRGGPQDEIFENGSRTWGRWTLNSAKVCLISAPQLLAYLRYTGGSFFGGTPSTIRWWREIYYSYHNKYLSQGVFVGKDQTLVNALLLLFPQRFGTVWVHDPLSPSNSTMQTGPIDLNGGRCGNTWYYFEWWMASQSEREAMKRSWDRTIGINRWWWKAMWFLLGRTEVLKETDLHFEEQGCRLTDALLVESLLRREDVFGSQWQIPARTVQQQHI